MIGITLLIVFGFVAAFLWAAQAGQYDDLVTPAYRILDNDDDDNGGKGNPQEEILDNERDIDINHYIDNKN